MREPHTSLPKDILPALQIGHLKYSYKGIKTLKCPFDLALYTLLLWNVKPRTIFEIGSYNGGSALWLADQLRAYGVDGRVLSFDVTPITNLSDPLVDYRFGDAGRLEDVLSAEELAALPRPFLVIEDSSHQKAHSLSVLNFFAPHMQSGEYIIIEDGIVIDLGVADEFGGGPAAAVGDFLAAHPHDWQIDTDYCDFFGPNVTWNINGYLRKV